MYSNKILKRIKKEKPPREPFEVPAAEAVFGRVADRVSVGPRKKHSEILDVTVRTDTVSPKGGIRCVLGNVFQSR